jgi:hypothetical protein
MLHCAIVSCIWLGKTFLAPEPGRRRPMIRGRLYNFEVALHLAFLFGSSGNFSGFALSITRYNHSFYLNNHSL